MKAIQHFIGKLLLYLFLVFAGVMLLLGTELNYNRTRVVERTGKLKQLVVNAADLYKLIK